ncbi:hypothetical protein WG79_13385, partial [Staphylococcus aureus subsp. aureus ST398]
YSDNILVKLFISEIVHTEGSFLLKLYYKFNFATEPIERTKRISKRVGNLEFVLFTNSAKLL